MFKSILAWLARNLQSLDRKLAAPASNDSIKNISVGLQNPSPSPRIGRWS